MSEVPATAAPAASPAPEAANPTQVPQPSQNAPAETNAQIDAAEASGEISKAEAKELRKQLQIKVDGKEEVVDLDFNDEDGLKKMVQKSKAFDKRAAEYAELRKQVEGFVSELKGAPIQVLNELGVNFDSLVESYVNEKLAEAEKSPEQLAQEKLEKELKELKAEKERLAKEKETAEFEQLKNQYAAEIETSIIDSLQKAETVLPKNNPLVVKRIAETMLLAMENGYQDVTAKDVIPLVEQQYMRDLQSMFDVFPEEVIEKVVGKKNLDRYRKKRIASRKSMKTQTANQIAQETGVISKKQEQSEAPKKSYRDYFRLHD